MILRVVAGAERPSRAITWEDDAGQVIPFATPAHTFELRVATPGGFSKTGGITGADVAPNVTIAFSAGELDDLPAGRWRAQLIATEGGLDRILPFWLYVDEEIPAP